MPLYEYQCDACAHRFEKIQKFSDPPVDVCPKCAAAVRKLVSSPAFHLKGTGWYITDYARKAGGANGSGGSDSGESGASGSDKPSSDSPAGASSGDAGKSPTASSGDAGKTANTPAPPAGKTS